MNIENIPQEMRNDRRWLLWKYETVEGKSKKVPYNALGRRVDITKESNWTDFKTVLAAYGHGYDGLGFVLGGKYVAIDLDKCFNSDGTLKQYAKSLLRVLPPTYTEISPSGKGLKLFYRAEQNFPKNIKKSFIEILASGRYSTVTGNKLPDAPVELALITNEQLQKITRLVEIAAQVEAGYYGEDLKKLFLGSWFDLNTPSPSEADWKLAQYLIQRCGVNHLDDLEFIFHLSALKRDKWYEPRGNTTYLRYTLEKALGTFNNTAVNPHVPDAENAVQNFLEALVPAEKWLYETPQVEWLWEGVLYRSAIHLLAGPPKKGKTRLLHELINRLSGTEFFSLTLMHKGSVVGEFTLADGTYWGLRYRGNCKILVITEESPAVWAHRDISVYEENVFFMPIYKAQHGGVETLGEVIKRNVFDLIVIDTFDKFIPLEDENDNAEIVTKLTPLINATHESRTALLLVHHFRKSGGEDGTEVRGASALLGAVDVYIAFKGEQGDSRRRVLEVISRFDAPAGPIRAVLEDPRWGMYRVITGQTAPQKKPSAPTQEAIIAYLQEHDSANVEELAAAAGKSTDAIEAALRRLEKKGLVKKVDSSWSLASSPSHI